MLLAPLLTLLYLAGAWTYGLYDPERADTAWAVVRGAVAAVTMGTLLTAAVAFFGGARTASFARSTILIAWVFDLALLTGWRLVFLRLGRVSWPEQRVLIVGTGETALDLAREVAARSRWGWRVTGLIEAGPEAALGLPPARRSRRARAAFGRRRRTSRRPRRTRRSWTASRCWARRRTWRAWRPSTVPTASSS